MGVRARSSRYYTYDCVVDRRHNDLLAIGCKSFIIVVRCCRSVRVWFECVRLSLPNRFPSQDGQTPQAPPRSTWRLALPTFTQYFLFSEVTTVTRE